MAQVFGWVFAVAQLELAAFVPGDPVRGGVHRGFEKRCRLGLDIFADVVEHVHGLVVPPSAAQSPWGFSSYSAAPSSRRPRGARSRLSEDSLFERLRAHFVKFFISVLVFQLSSVPPAKLRRHVD